MDLENKVIWELENWKKAEEAKFRYNLKEREAEFLKKLQNERKQKELGRDKLFKEHESRIVNLNLRMQQKMNKLLQRENKLVLLEEELKQRVNETSRQLAAKDDQIDTIRQKQQNKNKDLQRRIKNLEAKVDILEDEKAQIEDEYREYKKEQEKSPIQLIKNELRQKILEIEELKKQYDKNEEVKNEYRKHFERLKNEIMRLKKEVSSE